MTTAATSFKYFPILYPWHLRKAALETKRRHVPWGFIAPHEKQAIKNHGQTLQRLAERGGLSPCEMLVVMQGRCWSTITEADQLNAEQLIGIALNAWALNNLEDCAGL